MSSSEQRHPCDRHILIPDLVPLEQTGADPDKGLIIYGKIINGPGHVASIDMQAEIDGKKKRGVSADRERCLSSRVIDREPDMSGVAYDTEFTGF